MRIMRIMRIMRVSVGAPMSNNHATRIPPLPSSCLAYPNGKSCPLHYPVATLRPSHSNLWHCKPSGYNMTPPSSFYKTYKSYKSYASVTPTQTRIPPLPSSCLARPCGKSARCITQWQLFARAKPHCGTANPRGIT